MISGALKKLAGQTAIYGLPSIVGRFLNYLLVPLHTSILSNPADYGVITVMYAYVSLFVVILGYGMETCYFRRSQDENESSVFSSILFMLGLSSLLFVGLSFLFSTDLAEAIGYPGKDYYITVFALILGLDTLSSFALARLRHHEKAIKFATVNLVGIAINIGLNLVFLLVLHPYSLNNPEWAFAQYFNTTEMLVLSIFVANLIQSSVRFILALAFALKYKLGTINFSLLPAYFKYGFYIMVIGLFGIVNETADRIFLKSILGKELGQTQADFQIGVYGACYKLSILVSLFIQAFRFAAEPFFFKSASQENKRAQIATVLHYFLAFSLIVALGIALNLDFFKFFIQSEAYYEGLSIVPVLLLANVFLGISVNLSIWYKMSDKTYLGLYVALFGVLITVIGNYFFIPEYGYRASAYTTLVCYIGVAVISYLMGQKHFPIPYNIKLITILIIDAIAVYTIVKLINFENDVLNILLSNTLIIISTFIYWKTLQRYGQVSEN